jgi:hypothetical protein
MFKKLLSVGLVAGAIITGVSMSTGTASADSGPQCLQLEQNYEYWAGLTVQYEGYRQAAIRAGDDFSADYWYLQWEYADAHRIDAAQALMLSRC